MLPASGAFAFAAAASEVQHQLESSTDKGAPIGSHGDTGCSHGCSGHLSSHLFSMPAQAGTLVAKDLEEGAAFAPIQPFPVTLLDSFFRPPRLS